MLSSKVAQLLQRVSKDDASLTWLDLSGSRIGDTSVRRVASALAQNGSVVRVDLGGNTIGPRGLKHLCEALRARPVALASLNLRANPIGDQGAALLAELIGSACPSSLCVTQCSMGHVGMALLADALRTTTRLRELFVAEHGMGQAQKQLLREALEHNASLLVLYGVEDAEVGELLERNAGGYAKAREATLAWLCVCRFGRVLPGAGLIIARLLYGTRGERCWL